MRRALASLLFFLFSFSLIAPLFAADTEARLPACCRKHGKHGCSMESSAKGNKIATARTRCAAFPQKADLPSAAQQAAAPPAHNAALKLYSHPASLPQVAAKLRISLLRSAQKRGPPVLL